uniref:Uncharacterized protein n=1 Tax=Oncorhynchus tshawytscha TaxID=74940 RepID=A0A8C8EWV4_ONCTS
MANIHNQYIHTIYRSNSTVQITIHYTVYKMSVSSQSPLCSKVFFYLGCGDGNSVGYRSALGLEKVPSCFVFTSFSWYSMCMTSVFLMLEFSRNSSRILGRKPGLSWPARRNWRYRDNTCFCSLLWRAMVWNTGQQQHS